MRRNSGHFAARGSRLADAASRRFKPESVQEVRDSDRRFFEQYALDPIPLTLRGDSVVLPQRALRFVWSTATGDAELSKIRFDASLWPA